MRRSEDELGAVEEGAPDFEGGGVEGDGSGVEPDVGGREGDEGGRDEASDAAVRDADTLGLARGAGGEHDVGEVIPRHGTCERRRGQPRDARSLLIDDEEDGAEGRQVVDDVRVREDDARSGLTENESETLGGPGLVERDVGGPRLEDGEEGDDEVGGAVEADGDARAREHTQRAQVMSELVGARVELGVGDRLLAGDDSNSVGRAHGLLSEESMDGRVARVIANSPIPAREYLLLLFRREQRNQTELRIRGGTQRFNQYRVVTREALHGRRVKEVGVVVEDTSEAVAAFFDQEADVVLRGLDARLQCA